MEYVGFSRYSRPNLKTGLEEQNSNPMNPNIIHARHWTCWENAIGSDGFSHKSLQGLQCRRFTEGSKNPALCRLHRCPGGIQPLEQQDCQRRHILKSRTGQPYFKEFLHHNSIVFLLWQVFDEVCFTATCSGFARMIAVLQNNLQPSQNILEFCWRLWRKGNHIYFLLNWIFYERF